jgi:hypothetical protein
MLPRLLVVASVCLLAWMMFVVHLGYESMWSDEWFSWMYAVEGPLRLVRDTANDVHPPFYYLLLSGWVALTGSQNLFVMRLTAAIPALLAVAVSYRLGVAWFRSHRAGIAAAVFLATSGIFVYYARELRMYALTVLLVTLSWWFLTRYLSGHNRSLIGYAACVALMAYTYYFSAFALFAQVIVVLWFYRGKIGRLLVAYAGVLLAFLPWIPTLFSQMYYERARTGNPDAAIIGKFGATLPTTLPNIATFVESYTARQPAFVLLLVVLALGLSWYFARSLREWRWVVAAVLWAFLSVVLMFGLNVEFPIYNPRYLLPVIPGLALLVGVAAAWLPARRLSAALIVVIAVSGVLFHADAFLTPKTPHKELLQTVVAGYRPGDRIWYNFSYGGLGSSLTEEVAYHLKFDAPSLNPDEFVWDAPNDYADVQTVSRVWDVRPYWIPMPEEAATPLQNGRVVSEDVVFGAYEVKLYEAPPVNEPPIQVSDLFTLLPSGTAKNQYRPGERVTVKAWWETSSLPTLDYSYALNLVPQGEPIPSLNNTPVKLDGGLTADGIPTSQWIPDGTYRLSEISFDLPLNLPPGAYAVLLGVYYWQDPQPLLIRLAEETRAERIRAQIGIVTVTP